MKNDLKKENEKVENSLEKNLYPLSKEEKGLTKLRNNSEEINNFSNQRFESLERLPSERLENFSKSILDLEDKNLSKQSFENKAISIDCQLDKVLIEKIETFLRNKTPLNVWTKRSLNWQLNLFFEESLNNYKVKVKSFKNIPNYLRSEKIALKTITFSISESSFQIYHELPLESKNETIEKILNWWLVLSAKHLWPDCLYCIKENKATNGFCNLACIKEYLKNRENYHLCKHPIRDEANNIIFWEENCDCDKILSLLKYKQVDSWVVINKDGLI